MSARALVAVGAALLAALVLMRQIDEVPPAPAPSPRARQARPPRGGIAPPPVSSRNVFEYASRPVAETLVRPRPAAPPETPAVVPSPDAVPAVRLVGLVRRGGVLKAALQVPGGPVVVGKGESAGGYTVVDIDEDGVRLRAADGTILALAAGGS